MKTYVTLHNILTFFCMITSCAIMPSARESTSIASLTHILQEQDIQIITRDELGKMASQDRVLLQQLLKHKSEDEDDGDDEASSGNTKIVDALDLQELPEHSSDVDSSLEEPVAGSLKATPFASDTPLFKSASTKKKMRRSFGKREYQEHEATLIQQLDQAQRKRTQLSDHQWSHYVECTQHSGLFQQFATWVIQNNNLVSLAQMRQLFDSLVQEQELKTAGILPSEAAEEKPVKKKKAVANADKKKAKLAKFIKKSKFKLPAAYFSLLLRIVETYSEKLWDEVSVYISCNELGDLPEIVSTAIYTHPTPTCGETVQLLLREALENQDLTPLIEELRKIVTEMYSEKTVEVEKKELLEAALDSLDSILENQACLTDAQMFDSFASVHGAKLENGLFDALIARAVELDTFYGAERSDLEESACQMLKTWALRNYSSENRGVRMRLSAESFNKILDLKEPLTKKTRMIKIVNALAKRVADEGVISAARLQGIQGIGFQL